MAIDFPSSPTTGQVYAYAGVTYVYSAQGVWTTAGTGAVGIIGGSPQGRLTLQTATPVMTTTQSAKTTIYYTPYCGNQIGTYDGTNMVMTAFTELSNLTAQSSTGKAGPAAVAASSVYDLFVWNDAGTVRLTRGPLWTNDTTRSAGTALVMVNGVLLNNAAITNGPAASRGTYVGTVRSNASSQIDWSVGGSGSGGVQVKFCVWNCYNRRPCLGKVLDTTASWSTSTTYVNINNSANNSCLFVRGLNEDLVQGYCTVFPSISGNAHQLSYALDGVQTGEVYNITGVTVQTHGSYASYPSLGVHTLAPVEKNNGTALTVYGVDEMQILFYVWA